MEEPEIKKGKYTLSPEETKKLGKAIWDAHNGDLDQIGRFCMIILQTIMDMKGSEKLKISSTNKETGRLSKLKMETFR